MKRNGYLPLLTTAVISLCCLQSGQAAVYYAAPDGSASATCSQDDPGSIFRAFELLGRTADRGKGWDSGSELVLKDGVYDCSGRSPVPPNFKDKTPSLIELSFGNGWATIRSECGDPKRVVISGSGRDAGRFLTAAGRIRIRDITFRGFHTVASAAALSGLPYSTRYEVSNCVFEDCESQGDGGAVARGVYKDCTFRNCRSGGEGGAASVEWGTSFTGCRFEGCIAQSHGGGLKLKGVFNLFCAITNCSFVGCKSLHGAGGGVYVDADPRGKVPVIRCRFEECFSPLRLPANRRDTALCGYAMVDEGNVIVGTRMRACGGRKDGSVNTVCVKPGDDLAAARDYLRQNRDPGRMAEVVFEDGVYVLTNRIDFDEWDSSSIWRARHPGKVVIAGGWPFRADEMKPLGKDDPLRRRLGATANKVVAISVPEYLRNRFAPRSLAGGCPVWIGMNEDYNGFVGDLPQVYGPKYPKHPVLTIDTLPMQVARWPNAGWGSGRTWAEDGGYYVLAKTNVVQKGSGASNCVFKVGARVAKWETPPNDICVCGFIDSCDYSTSRVSLEDVDRAAGTVAVRHGALGGGCRMWFLNVLEELDVPGEWCYDRSSGRIVLYPPAGMKKDSFCVLGVSTDHFFRIRGSDIVLDGFSFTAKIAHPAVTLEGGERNVVRNCRFSGLEYEALFMSGRNSKVEFCDFTGIASAAIRFTGGDVRKDEKGGNSVENCRVWQVCQNKNGFATGGIFLDGGYGNAVRHCEIHDILEHGLDYYGFGHVIEYNRIWDVSYQFGDSGAVYSKGGGVSYGCVFRYNDISAAPGWVHGLYLDDSTSGHIVYGNISRGYGSAGIFVGGGRDNLISNNVMCAAAGCGLLVDNRGLFWPGYANPTNILANFAKQHRFREPGNRLAEIYPAFAAFTNDCIELVSPINNAWVNNVILDVNGGLASAVCGKGIKMKDGEFVSQGNVAILTRGSADGKEPIIWYLKGIKVLKGTEAAPLESGFADVPPMEKSGRRRTAYRKGDFNLKPDALVLRECPGFKPIPWDRIGCLDARKKQQTKELVK